MDDYPTFIKITEEPLHLEEWIEKINSPSSGAVCSFIGIVRGKTNRDGLPSSTQYLEYEAYVPMAEEKLLQIAGEIRVRWPSVQGIVLIQRVGQLYPQTPSVLVACSASHRDTGVFDAARYGIDRLKEIVPVWKKEVALNGETWIEGNYQPEEND